MFALAERGIRAQAQVPLKVQFRGHLVGEFFADIPVEHRIILELKAAKSLANEHEAQLMNYLKATALG